MQQHKVYVKRMEITNEHKAAQYEEKHHIVITVFYMWLPFQSFLFFFFT